MGHLGGAPNGSELVLCINGSAALTQEASDGTISTATVSADQAVANGPGVKHTADVVDGPTTVVFITAGVGTQMRDRAV